MPHAQDHRGLMKIKYPIQHGVVQDWNDMEKVWRHVYSKEQLHIQPEGVALAVIDFLT